jgi:nitroimidazol reductase NimA-like FMN-containing flavoprotein (pyridoxamine 5'-phosphate oxidase superfamily)
MAVTMSQAEIDEMLLNSPNIILCINRKNLPPLPVPMWFGWKDNIVYMHTLAASKKVQHLKANPQVSLLVESGADYFALKSVLIMGKAEVSEDQDVVKQYQAIIDEVKPQYKNQWRPKKYPPQLEKFYQRPRAAIRITPTSITTWDFAKIPR